MMISLYLKSVLGELVVVESRAQEIYHFMDELESFWIKHPNQRFLQMLYNVLTARYGISDLDAGKLYNLKDSELLEVIKKGKLS